MGKGEAIAILWTINDPPGLLRVKRRGKGEVTAIFWTINDPPGLQKFQRQGEGEVTVIFWTFIEPSGLQGLREAIGNPIWWTMHTLYKIYIRMHSSPWLALQLLPLRINDWLIFRSPSFSSICNYISLQLHLTIFKKINYDISLLFFFLTIP